MNQRPKIGVAVLIFKENQVLLGKRKNAHGEGTWQTPGGHLEFAEEPEACAQREVLEETGWVISEFQRGPYSNDIFLDEQKHYITLFLLARHPGGIPQVLEPEKCEGWAWFDCNNLPSPLFLPLVNLLKMRV